MFNLAARIVMGSAATWLLFTSLFSVFAALDFTHRGVTASLTGAIATVAAVSALVYCFRPYSPARTAVLVFAATDLGLRIGMILDLIEHDWFWETGNLFLYLGPGLAPTLLIVGLGAFLPPRAVATG